MASFESFYKDLKETEQKDSTLTPKQQIERLLRPGKLITIIIFLTFLDS